MGKLRAKVNSGNDFTPLADGRYEVIVTDWQLKTSAAGNEYVNWTMTVHEDEEEYAGRKLWLITVLSSWLLPQLLDAANAEYETVEDDDGNEVLEFDPDEVIGSNIQVDVITETYMGKEKNAIKKCHQSEIA